jgi:transcriptional regulator with XRE-family HTH domain
MSNKKHSHAELYRCLGQVISFRRKRLGLSQEELSEASGVDRSFLSSVERGKRNPSFGTVASIASGLRMRYTKLVSNCEACTRENVG